MALGYGNKNATRNHNVNNWKQTLPKTFQCGILYLKWYYYRNTWQQIYRIPFVAKNLLAERRRISRYSCDFKNPRT